MTAKILPFPNHFRPATPRDEPGEVVILPVMRRHPVECPKVQELRQRSKQLRKHFRRKRFE
jgi:hypothetical protein